MFKKINKFALNRKGFSLVELMIVVAIIGMLAAVGIPQYAKFQAKARQSEAKSNLAGLFNAQKSFQSEWNFYTVDLRNAGFGVEGKNLRYYTGFGPQSCASLGGASYTGPAEASAFTNTWSNGVTNTGGATWHNLVTLASAISLASSQSNCLQTSFTGVSVGDPRNTPTGIGNDVTSGDRWSIDHQKALRNTLVGIN
jgi:type IV pilus assembly protein PilA